MKETNPNVEAVWRAYRWAIWCGISIGVAASAFVALLIWLVSRSR